MSQKKVLESFFVLLLAIILGFAGYFTTDSCMKCYQYSSLSVKKDFDALVITPIEREEGFVLEAFVTYTMHGVSHKISEVFQKPVFVTKQQALQAIQARKATFQQVWVNPKHSHQASLQKNFPYEPVAKSIFYWCAFSYFLWLALQVSKQTEKKTELSKG